MAQQNKVIGLVGYRGAGKSTRLRDILQSRPRILVFDTVADHSDWLQNRIRDLDRLSRFLGWAATQSSAAASFIPEFDLEEAFDSVCELVYLAGEIAFVVEEVPMLCTAAHVPENFSRIMRLGRHRAIDCLYTGQRFAEIARGLTATTDAFILFSQTEPADLEALAKRCGRDVADRVAALPNYQAIGFEVRERKIFDGADFDPWAGEEK